MGFTLKALLSPALLFIISALIDHSAPRSHIGVALGTIALIWIWLAIPVVVLYWIARIWKRATRDSPDPHLYR